jgi:3-methyladenine DNA glycosylase AlkD
MKIDIVEKEIRDFCKKNTDAAVVKKYSRYFVEGYDAYGIQTKLMETEHARLINAYRAELGLAGFLDLGDRLVRTGKYEEASFAVLFAEDFRGEYTPATLERLGNWLDNGIRNWAHADMMAGGIVSYFLMKKIIPYTALSAWRTAESKWKRRVVPVSLIKILKVVGDIQDLLDFLSPMMLMPEKVVHQGLGWFLREAWKLYPQPVEVYLLRWKDSAPRLIFQYAIEKMTAEQKARFKRGGSVLMDIPPLTT